MAGPIRIATSSLVGNPIIGTVPIITDWTGASGGGTEFGTNTVFTQDNLPNGVLLTQDNSIPGGGEYRMSSLYKNGLSQKALISGSASGGTGTFNGGGVFLSRPSADTLRMTLDVLGTGNIRFTRWNSKDSAAAEVFSVPMPLGPIWLWLFDNGTTRIFPSFSLDGTRWCPLGNVAGYTYASAYGSGSASTRCGIHIQGQGATWEQVLISRTQ